MCVKRLLCWDSFTANRLCAISYSKEFSVLIVLTSRFKRFICKIVSTGRMPRSAKQTDFDVLSDKLIFVSGMASEISLDSPHTYV